LQCTDQEIFSFFNVSVAHRAVARKKPEFGESGWSAGRAKGQISLRRSLWSLAVKGNPAANIFLGEEPARIQSYLSNEHSGPVVGPIPLSSVEVLLQRRDRLAAERKAGSGNESGARTTHRQ